MANGRLIREFEYDSDGKPVRDILIGLDDEPLVTTYIYDENGKLIRCEGGEGALRGMREFDSNGNEIYRETGNLREKREYNEAGKLVYHEASQEDWTKWEYDADGKLIRDEDSKGSSITYEYDDTGKIVREINQSGVVSTYEYEYYPEEE